MLLMLHKVNFAAKYSTVIVMIIIDNKISGVFEGNNLLFCLQIGHISMIKNRKAMRANGCRRCLLIVS